MISHVDIWKTELQKELDLIVKVTAPEKRSVNATSREAAHAGVEKFTFITAYYVRKLREAKHLSDEFESSPVDVTSYTCIEANKSVEPYAIFKLSDYYNLKNPQAIRLPLNKFCNLLIHSFLFTTRFYREDARVFFNSDRTKNTTLYEVKLSKLVEFAQSVVDDKVVSHLTKYGPGERKTVKSRKALSFEELEKMFSI